MKRVPSPVIAAEGRGRRRRRGRGRGRTSSVDHDYGHDHGHGNTPRRLSRLGAGLDHGKACLSKVVCAVAPLAAGLRRVQFLRAVLLLSALMAACSEGKSFVVVSVYSSLPSIDNVAQLRVKVTDGLDNEQLLYPDQPLAAPDLLRLLDPNTPAATPVTFSVSFRPTFKADVTVEVEALDVTQASLGSGTSAPQPLNLGGVTYTRVIVTPPTCDPTAPASTCGDGYTCALVCEQNSQPNQLCFSAGKANPGDPCADTRDCVPGSGCFEFTTCSTVAQPIKTCRKFCTSDTDCGAGSSCIPGVACGNTSTSLRICSRPCDPTGDATGGCAAGLLCFTFTGGITDCACPQ